MPKGLPFELKSYLELVELTGRIMREDKLGHINNMTIPLLERLNLSPENWLKLTTQFIGVSIQVLSKKFCLPVIPVKVT